MPESISLHVFISDDNTTGVCNDDSTVSTLASFVHSIVGAGKRQDSFSTCYPNGYFRMKFVGDHIRTPTVRCIVRRLFMFKYSMQTKYKRIHRVNFSSGFFNIINV